MKRILIDLKLIELTVAKIAFIISVFNPQMRSQLFIEDWVQRIYLRSLPFVSFLVLRGCCHVDRSASLHETLTIITSLQPTPRQHHCPSNDRCATTKFFVKRLIFPLSRLPAIIGHPYVWRCRCHSSTNRLRWTHCTEGFGLFFNTACSSSRDSFITSYIRLANSSHVPGSPQVARRRPGAKLLPRDDPA